jgi:hypothetical protein
MKQVLEQAIYIIAHTQKDTAPSATILILLSWRHTPYLFRNLHKRCVQKLRKLPYIPVAWGLSIKPTYKLQHYLIANVLALNILNVPRTTQGLHSYTTATIGHPHNPVIIHLEKEGAPHIESSTKKS